MEHTTIIINADPLAAMAAANLAISGRTGTDSVNAVEFSDGSNTCSIAVHWSPDGHKKRPEVSIITDKEAWQLKGIINRRILNVSGKVYYCRVIA